MKHPGTTDRRSDQELVAVCNDGGPNEAAQAFGTLYQRHKDFVLRVALRFVRDADSALDVLQETFTYLLRKFPPTGPGLTLSVRMTTLLYPVAKNSAISLLRKIDRIPSAEGADPDEIPAPHTNDDTSDLESLLRGLADDHREAVTLRFVDGFTLQEIADLLEIPLGTVKSRLHLAIKALRELEETRKFFDR